jgi:N-acetyl-beta-hexosaminidase
VDHILRTLDAMSAGKLNVLHWHYSDSVAFSLRLDTLPQLGELVRGYPPPSPAHPSSFAPSVVFSCGLRLGMGMGMGWS